MKWDKRWAALLLLAALVGGGGWLLWHTGFFACLGSLEDMREYIQRFSPYSHLFYLLLQLLSVVVAPIPSNLTALAGALLFGTWTAFLLTWIAVVLGSLLVFGLARGLGRSFVDRMVSRAVSERYLELIRRKRDVLLILVFLFPFFPDDLICILAGLTDIPWRRFLVIVLLTRPWGLLAACLLGGSALHLPLWALILLGAAGIALFVVAVKYGDRWEKALLDHFRK